MANKRKSPITGPEYQDSKGTDTFIPHDLPAPATKEVTGDVTREVTPRTQPPAPQAPTMDLITYQQLRLSALFSSNTALTRENFANEIVLVARMAVADGEYGPAAKLYELAGKNLGAVDTKSDVHQHVHLHGQSNPSDFSRASDEELRKIIEESKATVAQHT